MSANMAQARMVSRFSATRDPIRFWEISFWGRQQNFQNKTRGQRNRRTSRMPKGKGGGDDRTKPVAEQILVEAARIYDAREGEDAESKDLKTYAEFLSKQDAFTKVCSPAQLCTCCVTRCVL